MLECSSFCMLDKETKKSNPVSYIMFYISLSLFNFKYVDLTSTCAVDKTELIYSFHFFLPTTHIRLLNVSTIHFLDESERGE